MRTQRPSHALLLKAAAVASCLAFTLGCAIHRAQSAYDEGRYEDALHQYREILQKDPTNVQAKIGYRRTAPLAAEAHLKKAGEAKAHGRGQDERREVAAAVVLDPSNAVAVDWMNRLEQDAARARARVEGETVDEARAMAEAKPNLPINPRSLEGMDLNFSHKTSLKEIFQQLSKNSGVNIILHSSVSTQDTTVSVDLRGLTFQRVLDTLMLQSDMFYKVLDPNTIMVFKKTPQNLQEYENKLIQTFYLSNAEVDNVRQIFNAIMPQMRVFIDKRLNAITVQAKPTDLSIAQRIVGQLDKAKPEVMIYLELLEVSETAQETVGLIPTVNLTDPTQAGLYRLGAVTSSYGTNGLNQDTGGIRITKSQLNFLFPPLALDALKNSGDGKLLASPNVRVVSGETGEVNIGQKVSITQSSLGGLGGGTTPTTGAAGTTPLGSALTSIAGGIGGGTLAAQTQFSYEDVGVHIKVKPRVHFNGDITVDLESDVKTVVAGSQPGRPDLGQRVIKTSARLHDGETAVFGGLLKEDETKSLQGIWGVTDLPIIGSLLGHTDRNKSRTDVILTLRAVVVRKPDLAMADFEPFDPDMAPGAAKPFAPKPEKKALPSGFRDDVTIPPVPAAQAPAPAPGPKPGPAPAQAPAAQAPASGPAPAAQPSSLPVPGASVPVPGAAAPKAQPEPQPADAAGDASSLVFFMSPLSAEAAKGQHVNLSLFASGAQGLSSGSMTVKVDPKLKVVAIAPGDFITAENGSLQQTRGADGSYTLTFSRPGTASDSGTFAVLELEAVDPGKATVLIQDGRYLVGANPIPARYVNALVTVQ